MTRGVHGGQRAATAGEMGQSVHVRNVLKTQNHVQGEGDEMIQLIKSPAQTIKDLEVECQYLFDDRRFLVVLLGSVLESISSVIAIMKTPSMYQALGVIGVVSQLQSIQTELAMLINERESNGPEGAGEEG